MRLLAKRTVQQLAHVAGTLSGDTVALTGLAAFFRARLKIAPSRALVILVLAAAAMSPSLVADARSSLFVAARSWATAIRLACFFELLVKPSATLVLAELTVESLGALASPETETILAFPVKAGALTVANIG